MKSFSFAKALTLGCFVCLSFPIACGDDDDDVPNKPNGGSGGAGASDAGGGPSDDGGTPGTDGGAAPLPPGLSATPSTEECGENMCDSAAVAGGVVNVNPCCGADDSCGLDSGFLGLVGANFKDRCQVKNQPGDLDDACPAATGLMVPFQGANIALDAFAGCCRPNGTCGVVVNAVTSGNGKVPLAGFGLGCVDGAPFFGGEVTTCGAGGSGSGGSGAGGSGAGGEPTTPAGGAGGAGGAQ